MSVRNHLLIASATAVILAGCGGGDDDKIGVLSKRGEVCASSLDCEQGLICVPHEDSGTGWCDLASYGLTPTDKSCWAECRVASDCCELPVEEMTEYTEPGNSSPTTVTPRSCSDLRKILGSTGDTNPGGCDGTAIGSYFPHSCLLYKAYCECSETQQPWECTDGSCVYTRSCQADGYAAKGCPSYSRAGRALTSACNMTANTCGLSSGEGCHADVDCEAGAGLPVTADPYQSADTCSKGECVCLADEGLCYRRCDDDLDCERGYACDNRKVCAPMGQCDSDPYCAIVMRDVTAKCVASECKVPCAADWECEGSGLQDGTDFGDGAIAYVCYQGFCTELGCSTDLQCQADTHVKLFCELEGLNPDAHAAHSAITD